jgi:DNA mismatch repair protein MutS
VHISGRALVALEKEIAFYLGAARLVRRLRDGGLPMSRPEIAPLDERTCSIHTLYNVSLALQFSKRVNDLREEIVCNDVEFGDEGRIFILTGPNRGGKTTYTQAVGLAHVFMQAGLFVPASSARISPVDGIFTHFATEERPDLEAGRLGEESRRLSAIFERATRHSLILLNESLSSTSAGESLYLARDIVRVMRLLGARAIFATHLHELAADAEAINSETAGDSRVVSMISLVHVDGETARRTYKIVPGAPMGMSYAREIAARYGISFEQLTEALRARNVIPPS